MAASAGKTIGLILFIIVILFVSVRVTPLILAPLGIFSGAAQLMHGPDIRVGGWGYRWTSMNIFSLALLFIWIAVIIWVYRDAEKRGMNGVLWALLVLIGNLIALIIYLIVRSDAASGQRNGSSASTPAPSPPASTIPVDTPVPALVPAEKTAACPKCSRTVPAEFTFCPHCGSAMQPKCPACGKAVEKSWNACPYCGEKFGGE